MITTIINCSKCNNSVSVELTSWIHDIGITTSKVIRIYKNAHLRVCQRCKDEYNLITKNSNTIIQSVSNT